MLIGIFQSFFYTTSSSYIDCISFSRMIAVRNNLTQNKFFEYIAAFSLYPISIELEQPWSL